MAALLSLSLLAPAANAGTADDPDLKDPADAPATPWGDVLAAWVEETPEELVFTVKVVELDGHPPGEVGLRFALDGTYWLVGTTTIPTDAGLYRGGFHCPGEASSFDTPDTARCDALNATEAGGLLTIHAPRTLLAADPGSRITGITAYSELLTGPDGGLDQAGPGRDIELASPPPPPPPPAKPLPPPATSPAPTVETSAPESPPSKASPGASVAFVALLLGCSALRRLRPGQS